MEERQLQHVHESVLHELYPFFFFSFLFCVNAESLFGFAFELIAHETVLHGTIEKKTDGQLVVNS